MMKPAFAILPISCLALATGAAKAEDSIGYNLQATVAVVCSVKFEAAGGTSVDGASRLGMIKEYCNAPGGYQLVVQYSPGSLRGAVVNVGESRVVLDGSGTAIIAGARGPKIQSRELIIMPSPNGFDTESFSISAQLN
jgi:hypothetical protein